MSKYTTKYFTKFFKGIPAKKWKVGSSSKGDATGCALHHAGTRSLKSVSALINLFGRANLTVSGVNDHASCGSFHNFMQETPKARILAALEYIEGTLKRS